MREGGGEDLREDERTGEEERIGERDVQEI